MKVAKLRVGQEVWIPCEIRSGPFSNERRVYFKIGDEEWFGFVNESELRGEKIRGKIIALKPDSVVIGIHGISPTSRAIATALKNIEGLHPVAAGSY